MSTPADIYVFTDEILPSPISDVTVCVLDPSANFGLVAMVQTDAQGKAAMLLPGTVEGRQFEARFYKSGVIFPGPRRIMVVEPPTSEGNSFILRGALDSIRPATDPRLCRCRARFVGFDNRPLSGKMFRIQQKAESGFESPKIVDGNLVSASTYGVLSDGNGFIEVDLHRGGEYYCTYAGQEDRVWNFKVPDRYSANLVDLIHPQPVSLTWDAPNNAVEVQEGQGISVPLEVLFSDYTTLSQGLDKWLFLTSSDEAVAQVRYASGSAVILGVAPGMATITAACPKGISPVRLPDYQLTGPTLQVTVTQLP